MRITNSVPRAICPFCKSRNTRTSSKIQPDIGYSSRVHCGDCGSKGPWKPSQDEARIAFQHPEYACTSDTAKHLIKTLIKYVKMFPWGAYKYMIKELEETIAEGERFLEHGNCLIELTTPDELSYIIKLVDDLGGFRRITNYGKELISFCPSCGNTQGKGHSKDCVYIKLKTILEEKSKEYRIKNSLLHSPCSKRIKHIKYKYPPHCLYCLCNINEKELDELIQIYLKYCTNEDDRDKAQNYLKEYQDEMKEYGGILVAPYSHSVWCAKAQGMISK